MVQSGPRVSLDVMVERKVLPIWELNPGCLADSLDMKLTVLFHLCMIEENHEKSVKINIEIKTDSVQHANQMHYHKANLGEVNVRMEQTLMLNQRVLGFISVEECCR